MIANNSRKIYHNTSIIEDPAVHEISLMAKGHKRAGWGPSGIWSQEDAFVRLLGEIPQALQEILQGRIPNKTSEA